MHCKLFCDMLNLIHSNYPEEPLKHDLNNKNRGDNNEISNSNNQHKNMTIVNDENNTNGDLKDKETQNCTYTKKIEENINNQINTTSNIVNDIHIMNFNNEVTDKNNEMNIEVEKNTSELLNSNTNSLENKPILKEVVSTSNNHLHSYQPKSVPTLSKYKILEEISGGTYGVVYKGEDIVTKKLVALKRMPLMSDREGVRNSFIFLF